MNFEQDKKSSLVHVTHITSGDLWAGAEVQLFTLCKSLNYFMDISVSVILLNHGILEEKLLESGIAVKVLDETQLNGFQIGWQLVRELRRQRPDIVHTHRLKENILGSLAAKMAHIPSLRSVHGAPEHHPSWLRPHKHLLYLLDWFTAYYLQTKIIAVSDELKNLLKSKYPNSKILVIENGVDIESLNCYTKPVPPENSNGQRQYKVGLVGRLVPVKRIDLFIQIAKYLQELHPETPIQYHIYGDGPLQDELQKQAKTLDVEDLIHFEGHCTDIHTQIASLDALLISSDHEGLPMTLLEAMALGTPVVAHSVGGISTVCQNGKYCWLVDNNSIDKLAKKLFECLQNRPARIDKANLAIKRVQECYSAETNAKSYMRIYQSKPI